MPLTIERLTSLAEVDGVMDVESASFTNPWTREMYLSELSEGGTAQVLLARDESGRIVGFCSFWRVLDELHMNNLAVLPDHRRRGVASEMLERLIAESRKSGVRRAMLEVRRSNEPAIHLYERFGFAVRAVRRAYYRNPEEDALVLWLEVEPAPAQGP